MKRNTFLLVLACAGLVAACGGSDGDANPSAAPPASNLSTVQGQTIALALEGGHFSLTDSSGSPGYVGFANLQASNGVVHVISRVLLPK